MMNNVPTVTGLCITDGTQSTGTRSTPTTAKGGEGRRQSSPKSARAAAKRTTKRKSK